MVIVYLKMTTVVNTTKKTSFLRRIIIKTYKILYNGTFFLLCLLFQIELYWYTTTLQQLKVWYKPELLAKK